MGRVKLEIKKIPNHTNRQVTFPKRRNGLIKKAYELCVLSNIDLALIMFSPSGRLVSFSGRRRLEDVLIRYLNLPEEEILSGLACPRRDGGVVLENREALIGILNRLKHEDESAFSQTNETVMKTDDEIIEEITQEISLLHEQLETAEEELSIFEPDPLDITSLEELESLEQKILKMLGCIRERKVSSTGFCAMLQGTSSNMDPRRIMEDEVVFHPENENPSVSWKYPYTSPYSYASHMETAHVFQQALQHEKEELDMGSMPSGQVETFSEQIQFCNQHEEEDQGIWSVQQGQADAFLPLLQDEDGQRKCAISKGQPEILLSPHQLEKGQPLKVSDMTCTQLSESYNMGETK